MRPPRRTGATTQSATARVDQRGFNPRPPRRTGATRRDGHLNPLIRSFNPRPPRRTGATSRPMRIMRGLRSFNPRPPRRTGATALPHQGLKSRISAVVSANVSNCHHDAPASPSLDSSKSLRNNRNTTCAILPTIDHRTRFAQPAYRTNGSSKSTLPSNP